MVDHALGIAGCARCVVERDGVPLVVRHAPIEIGIAAADEGFIVDGAQFFAGLGEFQVVVVDDERAHFGELQGGLDGGREFAVGNEDFGLGVIKLEGDDCGVKACIDRVDDGAGHGNGVVGFEHCRDVGQHHGDGIANTDVAGGEGRR